MSCSVTVLVLKPRIFQNMYINRYILSENFMIKCLTQVYIKYILRKFKEKAV